MDDTTITAINKTQSHNSQWLRKSIESIVEISALDAMYKRRMHKFLRHMPDGIIAKWADSLNIDYYGGSYSCPDFPTLIKENKYRALVRRCFMDSTGITLSTELQQLIVLVRKLAGSDVLPVDRDIVERGVCSLALCHCTDEGKSFMKYAAHILAECGHEDDVLTGYRLALENGDSNTLREFDEALQSTPFGKWVIDRLAETRRFLGLEPPHFTVSYGPRNPQWDVFWQSIVTEGNHNDQ